MSRLAVQMYTVRDFTKDAKGLAETLRKISDIGYPAVQMSAVGCMNGAMTMPRSRTPGVVMAFPAK